MQPRSSQDATYFVFSSAPKSASDELVYDNLLLKDLLVSQLDNLRTQTLVDERNANTYDWLTD